MDSLKNIILVIFLLFIAMLFIGPIVIPIVFSILHPSTGGLI